MTKAIAATLRQLAIDDVLPGPQDTATRIPPVLAAYARRVEAENLWIVYRMFEERVHVVTIVSSPPVPDA